MDRWWNDNEAWFKKHRMLFNSHACICVFKGASTAMGVYCNEALVTELVGLVKQLVVQYCTLNGWKKVCHTKLEA